LDDLSDTEVLALEHDWRYWARPEQLPPAGEWRTWLVLAGRGFGKTRTGAEWVRSEAEAGRRGRIAVVGPTAADARDVMVEGESGLLAIAPRHARPTYEPSKRRLTWPNGALATLYSADEPDRLRGPQHDGAWCDEAGVWKAPEAWDMLLFGLRLGHDPRVVVTATPKPVQLIRDLVADPHTVMTRGSTFDNADHLPRAFLEQVVGRYEGTRLGRQELHAELLDDVEGALWSRAMLEACRVRTAPDMQRVVVAIDPAVTSGEHADETGVIVAGLGVDGHGYVLADLTCRLSPEGWARRAITAYREHAADRIVAEVNNGGDLVEATLRAVDRTVSYRKVSASRGKRVRAEPVAALYEQGRVHHVGGYPHLEDQMCSYAPDHYDGSPDRLDALVWAITELQLGGARGMQAW
jgi:phage terminase large subunit-like protein